MIRLQILISLFLLYSVSCLSQDSVYTRYDLPATVIGGIDSLYDAVSTRTIIQNDCACSEARVFVAYTVTNAGKVQDLNIIKKLCCKADSVAIQIVKNLRCRPATYMNKPIHSRRTIPICFYRKND